NLRSQPRAKVPHLVRPLLELRVVGDATLESDCLVLGAAGGLSCGARVATLAVLDDLRRPLERADLRDTRHVAAVPLHPELEVLVRIEPLGIYAELSHGFSLNVDLTSELLDLDDHELGGFQRCEAYQDVDDSAVHIVR